MFTCFTEPIKDRRLARNRVLLFNSPFVELETELPLAIPVVTAIALYGYYHAYCFVEKHNELMT